MSGGKGDLQTRSVEVQAACQRMPEGTWSTDGKCCATSLPDPAGYHSRCLHPPTCARKSNQSTLQLLRANLPETSFLVLLRPTLNLFERLGKQDVNCFEGHTSTCGTTCKKIRACIASCRTCTASTARFQQHQLAIDVGGWPRPVPLYIGAASYRGSVHRHRPRSAAHIICVSPPCECRMTHVRCSMAPALRGCT